MGATTGVSSPAQRVTLATRRIEAWRVGLDDPTPVTIAIASLILGTFLLVRLTGGAPSALMELGYAPVALAAYARGRIGGLGAGLLVAAVLGPVPSLLGMGGAESPPEWLIRATSFGGIGLLIGQLLHRSEREAGRIRHHLVEYAERERQSLVALAKAAESRDTDAGEHVQRLSLSSHRLAIAAGLSDGAAADVAWSSMLHDIGKLRVPERVLLKSEPLDADEWRVIRLHPIWSEQALARGEHLEVARQIARSHHENWDGTGYPDALYGDRIPLPARIVRITDAFDAMTNRRPYQLPISFEAALEELQAGAGHDFDPDLVQQFCDLIRRDTDLRDRLMALRLV